MCVHEIGRVRVSCACVQLCVRARVRVSVCEGVHMHENVHTHVIFIYNLYCHIFGHTFFGHTSG